ncbi:MAG: hypothetical protein ACYTAN_12905 [Planctomycetota bacterium]|jgi:hypothetical protein
MKAKRHRIHWQLTLWIGLVLCGLGIIVLAAEGTLQKKRLIEARAEYMDEQVGLLSMALQKEVDPRSRSELLETYCATMRFHGRPGHALGIIDSSGAFYRSSESITREQLLSNPHVKALLKGSAVGANWTELSTGGPSLVVARSIRTGPGGAIGVVYYSEWFDDIVALSRALFLQGAGFLLLLMLAVTAVVWLFVKYKVADPLDALLLSQYAVSRGDSSPLRTVGAVSYRDPHNEISMVCDMFSYMTTKIEEHEGQVDSGGKPGSLKIAVAEIENGLSRLQDAVGWIETRGDALPERSRQVLASLMQKGREARDLASALKGGLEDCPEYDDVESAKLTPEDPDEG